MRYLLIFMMAVTAKSFSQTSLIPKAAALKPESGNFVLNAATALSYDGSNKKLQQTVLFFRNTIEQVSGIRLKEGKATKNVI